MQKSFTTSLAAMYGLSAPARLVGLYRKSGGPTRYVHAYWTTQRFQMHEPDRSRSYRPIIWLLRTGMLAQVLVGVALIYQGVFKDVAGSAYIGLAVLICYQLVWAHILFFLALIWQLMHPKRYGKAVLCALLERQVKTLRQRNDFTLIAVAGSVGKTSTKLAIAQALKASGKRVCYQVGNYNDRATVPLIFFGKDEPNIFDITAWLKLLRSNAKQLKNPYPYDYVIVEIGTDGPGQISQFAYLRPELTVLTAVAEEHMEYFQTIEAVGTEETAVFGFSTQVLVNTDDVDDQFLTNESFVSYGLKAGDYSVHLAGSPTLTGQKMTLRLQNDTITIQSHFLGTQGAKVMLAAAAVAHMMAIDTTSLKQVLESIEPFAGRMQILPGINQTTLIDDTYNASPAAVRAGLDVLYATDTPQRIAILGSMNELGAASAAAHEAVGSYCDPAKLNLVVTIGNEAKLYLAPAAKQAGCEVKSFKSPHKAGSFVAQQLKRRAVVFAKGSQNGVFAEEALKPLLKNADDAQKLVRQSAAWHKVKKSQFGG